MIFSKGGGKKIQTIRIDNTRVRSELIIWFA